MGVRVIMFFLTKMNKRTVLTVIAMVLVVVALIMIDRFTETPTDSGLDCRVETQAQRVDFLKNFGWETDSKGETSDIIVIPEVFDEVYAKYNDIQTAQGFDLSAYRGKTVTRYTLPILNYPDCDDEVFADILVLNGAVIGGDVCTYSSDGFMHGFALDETTGLMIGKEALSD